MIALVEREINTNRLVVCSIAVTFHTGDGRQLITRQQRLFDGWRKRQGERKRIRLETQVVFALDGSTDPTESVLRGDSELGIHPERAEEVTLHQKAAQGNRGVLVHSTGIHGTRAR